MPKTQVDRAIDRAVLRKLQPSLQDLGLSPRCPAHPTYRGIRKPRVDCEPCEVVYDNEQRARADERMQQARLEAMIDATKRRRVDRES